MTPNTHNPQRNAKRKAESPEEQQQQQSTTASNRPQRKKQKRSSSPAPPAPPSPVAQTKPPVQSALTKHLFALYNEIYNATDDEYFYPTSDLKLY